jgi:hypothetical protein
MAQNDKETQNPANKGSDMPGGEMDSTEGTVGGTAPSPSRSHLNENQQQDKSIIADTNPETVGGVPGITGGTSGGSGTLKNKEATTSPNTNPQPQEAPGDVPDIAEEYQWIGVSKDSADDERLVRRDE